MMNLTLNFVCAFPALLKGRVQRWAKIALIGVQYVFRNKSGCSDDILVLHRFVDQHEVGRQLLHICFLYLTNVYDSVDKDIA